MSAFLVTESLIQEIKSQIHDFICLNFANGDMVGHTGIMSAAIKACEAVDKCVKEVVNEALSNNYTIPKDYFFALGDNSYNSHDSRYFGPVSKGAVIGKPCFIYYPFTKRWGQPK